MRPKWLDFFFLFDERGVRQVSKAFDWLLKEGRVNKVKVFVKCHCPESRDNEGKQKIDPLSLHCAQQLFRNYIKERAARPSTGE